MTKEERISRALISRDRCIAEISKVTDKDDQRSLWKAALKYQGLAKEIEAGETLENVRRPLTATQGGVGAGCEWMR